MQYNLLHTSEIPRKLKSTRTLEKEGVASWSVWNLDCALKCIYILPFFVAQKTHTKNITITLTVILLCTIYMHCIYYLISLDAHKYQIHCRVDKTMYQINQEMQLTSRETWIQTQVCLTPNLVWNTVLTVEEKNIQKNEFKTYQDQVKKEFKFLKRILTWDKLYKSLQFLKEKQHQKCIVPLK